MRGVYCNQGCEQIIEISESVLKREKTPEGHMAQFRIHLVVPVVSSAIAIGGILVAAPQQPAPPAPPPNITRTPAQQQIDPPEPAPGQGVDLTIKIIDAMTGSGLPAVAIELRRTPPQLTPANIAQFQTLDRRRWSYTKTTDGKGEVTIPNVLADAYTIVPTLTGYALAKGAPESIMLVAAKKTTPVTMRMWRAVTVEGTVVDPDKNPVPGATVEILTEGWTGGLRTMALAQPSVVTDPSGNFSFPTILSGTYFMRVRPPQALVQQQLKATAPKPEALVDTMYPGVLYMEQATPIPVGESNLFGVRVEMKSSPYFTLKGRVYGIPPEVKSSGLVLMRRVGFDSPFPFLWATPYDGSLRAQLAPDGTFIAPNIPPGPYWAGYTPAGPVRGGTQFLIADRDVDNFSFDVTPGVALSGRAVYEDGTPVEAGRTASLGVFISNMGVYPRDFAIERNGEFNVSGLPTGAYRMDFADGLVIKRVDLNAQRYTGGDFELNSAPTGPATLTLSRQGGGIQGSVDVHDRAKSYARGMITIAKQPFRATDTVQRKYLNGATTFAVEHLEAGHYRVCAWLEEGSDVDRVLGNPQYENQLSGRCESVEISGDEKRSVMLKQLSTVDFRN